MMRRREVSGPILVSTLLLAACGQGQNGFDGGGDVAGDGLAIDVRGDTIHDGAPPRDVQPVDVAYDHSLNPDASCASTSAAATVERLPVDIIWMVDNSISMAPAIDQVIAGLNNFASVISSRGFDYHVVMLSLRNVNRTVTINGGTRYTVCIPPPLAGDGACGNGPRFFQSSIDVRSTQPLEQFLGTLGQTPGYTPTDSRGGEPWRSFLRNEATKTIVIVTDDNSRLSADYFLHFAGGANPNNGTLTLPPGILDPSWGGLFDALTFDGLYGWGSTTDAAVKCHYGDGTLPPSSGPVYTTLVTTTMGVRAQICDGASAWGPFFDSIASAVERTSRLSCDIAIPPPPSGMTLDPTLINVVFNGASRTLIGKVANAAACGPSGGWYYDNDTNPMRVILCPATCTRAQTELRGAGYGVEVQFGCSTIPG